MNTMKNLQKGSLPPHATVDAVRDFLVRVDELDKHAEDLGSEIVAERLTHLIVGVADALTGTADFPRTQNLMATLSRAMEAQEDDDDTLGELDPRHHNHVEDPLIVEET